MRRAGVNAEFLDDVSAKLTPGKWAVVSEISEEWVTPVDTRMEALGGIVFRTHEGMLNTNNMPEMRLLSKRTSPS